jgi:8-oxo-dGTP pyrophosphatase MutT (NUDIX family)
MRIRAGIILVKDNQIALIERHRAGLHYFVFPGGGVDEGESLEQAAVREALEELGLEVAIKQKIAEVQLGKKSRQIYFLAEQTGGEFGKGTGEEFTDSDPNHPDEGIYIPIWMPVHELVLRDNVYPADVSKLILKSITDGWPQETVIVWEDPK